MTIEQDDRSSRHRGADVLATVLTYATALFLSYVVTFVLFLTTPFHPFGPYRGRTCEPPHLVFGQICRDLVERGMTSATRVGWGAVFLGGFLLLALLARRFVWIFLLVPLATIPYVKTEQRTWIVVTMVSIGATAVIAGLRLLVRTGPLPQARFVPIGFLAVGTACATVLSILTSGPPLPTLTGVPGLVAWPSAYLQGIACPAPSTCVIVGNGSSQPIALTLRRNSWGAPVPVKGADSLGLVACASAGNCVADDFNVRISFEHDGTWRPDDGGPNFLLSPTAACSPHGLCWVTYQRFVSTGDNSSHEVPDAIGESDGHWLPIHQVGPVRPARDKAKQWSVAVSGISCWSATSCTLTGSVAVGEGPLRAFVQTESSGIWAPAAWMPGGLGGSPKDHFGTLPFFSPITCTASNDCLLGGFEGRGTSPTIGAAVEQDVDGRWLPTTIGTGGQLGGQYSQVVQVACHTAALCVAAGGGNSHGRGWLFFRAEVSGRWQRARIVPINGGYSVIGSAAHLSAAACPTASTCYVVGWWVRSSFFNRLGFVASYVHGRWSFNVYALGRGEASTQLQALGCDTTACWAVGNAFFADGQNLGFTYPLVRFSR